jgi:hypothetical protein
MNVVMAAWEDLTAMLPRTPISFGLCRKRGQKPGKLRGFRWTAGSFSEAKEKKNSLKMKERSRNVIENKGPLWKIRERSGNVVENTGG